MFSLSVIVGATTWSLLYQNEESAIVAIKTFDDTPEYVFLSDDFGQRATLKYKSIDGWMLEDMDKSKIAHQERMLFAERVRLGAAKVASTDPAFRQPMLNGPAMLSPGFPRN